MDTISAQRAMRVAKSYIDETDDINLTDKVVVRAARTTLSRAGDQIAQAFKSDPQATVDVDGVPADIPWLKARALLREARTWEAFNLTRTIELRSCRQPKPTRRTPTPFTSSAFTSLKRPQPKTSGIVRPCSKPRSSNPKIPRYSKTSTGQRI